MRTKYCFATLSMLIPLLLWCESGLGWGFFAHKWIHRVAVDALPDEIRPFFESHKTYLAEHAIDPDLWVDDDPNEQVRHFIDIDMYGSYPFRELPRSFDEAVEKFGQKTVEERGIAPWWILRTFDNLVRAMRAGHQDSILVLAAALGHYVSDLHMPLHNVENYDGQLSGNTGIHARFESWMIEKYVEEIQLRAGKASYIQQPSSYIFDVVLQGVKLSEHVLEADNRAKLPHKSYEQPEDYDSDYFAALFNEVGELAERRMSAAANAVASFWYSAWIRAGEPVLIANSTP